MDHITATRLTEVVEALVEGGAFDELPSVSRFAELSMSRMGNGTLRAVAEKMSDKLRERGLATATEDGVSIPMHPIVPGVYLLVLAHLARETGARRGVDLHPVTNAGGAGERFRGLLELKSMPSRGEVIDFDLQVVVAVDLDDIPLDDVLQFKRESAGAHRKYMQHLPGVRAGSQHNGRDRSAAGAGRPARRPGRRRPRSATAGADGVAESEGRGGVRVRDCGRGVVGRERQPDPGGTDRDRRRTHDGPEHGTRQRLLVPLRRAEAT